MFKRLIVGSVFALAITLAASPVFADFQPIEPGVTAATMELKVAVATTHGGVVSGIEDGNYIVGFSFEATTASAWVVLYDASTTTAPSNSVVIGEAMLATQYESKEVTLPQPYPVDNGLVVDFIDTTSVIIYYY